jgi:peptidoglycan hydrolase FlgJ
MSNAGFPLPPVGATSAAADGNDPKLHRVAQRFEAMFLGEMIRLSRPKPDAASPFGSGAGEQLWGSFMNEALGKALAAEGGTGLAKQIEAALARAQHAAGGSGT